MLEGIGFSDEEVHKSSVFEIINQCVLRTSLHNPDATDYVSAVVPDKTAAERLAELTGSTNISHVGDICFIPATLTKETAAYTKTQRNQRNKRNNSIHRVGNHVLSV